MVRVKGPDWTTLQRLCRHRQTKSGNSLLTKSGNSLLTKSGNSLLTKSGNSLLTKRQDSSLFWPRQWVHKGQDVASCQCSGPLISWCHWGWRVGGRNQHQHIQRSTYPFENIRAQLKTQIRHGKLLHTKKTPFIEAMKLLQSTLFDKPINILTIDSIQAMNRQFPNIFFLVLSS